MAERIQVIVEAKDASSGVMRAITAQFGALGGLVEELTAKNISWGNVAQQATTLVIDGMKKSIQATVEYANQVRSLSALSGESAENTSRFIQVLDDFKIGADDATAATRALTKNGLTPNIETLAKLSDQYLALNTVQARNEFVIKNLGRAGLQWVEVLGKGSAALKEMGQNVDASLILNQKALDDARKYEIAMDNWNDSVQALQISLGQDFLPVLTNFINGLNDVMAAEKTATEEGKNWSLMSYDQKFAAQEAARAAREHADALLLTAEGALKAQEAVSQLDYKDVITTTLGMQDAQNKLRDSQTEVVSKMRELDKAYAAGEVTTDEFNTQMAGLRKTYINNATEAELWAKRTIFAMVQTRLAASGGGIDSNEFKFITDLGVEMGLIDQKTADTATSINQSLDELDTKGAQAEVKNFSTKWQDLLDMPKTVTFDVILNQSGTVPVITPPTSVQYNYDGTVDHDGDRTNSLAKGGWVHAARGMWMGQPRGTDTVPAMLTPGERVLSVPEVARMGGRAGVESAINGGTNVFYGPNNFIVMDEAMDIMELR